MKLLDLILVGCKTRVQWVYVLWASFKQSACVSVRKNKILGCILGNVFVQSAYVHLIALKSFGVGVLTKSEIRMHLGYGYLTGPQWA